MSEIDEPPVVTVFLRHSGDVLLLQRSPDVSSYPGRWAAVAGHVEAGDPLSTALHEIEEETGLQEPDVTLVREGPPFPVDDEDRGTRWLVHPFLFDTETRSVQTNWETAHFEWVAPTALLRRNTVPELWTSYRRVAPSVLTLIDDTASGSSALSIRALEVLRDRAGVLARSESAAIEDARSQIVEIAHRLLEARPSMAALANRVHRVMHTCPPELTPSSVETTAHEAIEHAQAADADAAQTTAEHVAGAHVLTLSRSGTVLRALRRADPPPAVSVAVSAPGEEGIGVAETLAGADLDVTLLPDAGVAYYLTDADVDLVLVGADTILHSGAVVNKVGTFSTALAAARADVPMYVASASDKIAVGEHTVDEWASPRSVYEGSADIDVWAPRFDTTPAELVTGGFFTERGRLSPGEVEPLVNELERLRDWM